MHFFFKTPFLTPWQPAKKIFSHPYTLVVLVDTEKHYTTEEKQAKKNLGQISTQPRTDFQLKKGQILDRFSTLQRIYIYMQWG